ncbi:MAG: hypothetical protein H0V61_10035, partial [Chitinophagales bacterium]|nr:hypothetical protein [Chitinophagales bacterium]
MEKSLLIFIACALILNNSYSRHSPGYIGGKSPAGNGGNESIDDRITYLCSVMLPATTTVPYTLTFTCDGTVKTSTVVATRPAALSYALNNWSAYGTWTGKAGVLQVKSNCENCSIAYTLTSSLTDTCSVMLPATTTIPYTLTFTCDGTVKTSTEVATRSEALAYALDNWSAYGTWTRTGGILQVLSNCDNCSINYNLTSSLTDTCSVMLPSTTTVPYTLTFTCDGTVLTSTEIMTLEEAQAYFQTNWSSYGTWTHAKGVLQVISDCDNCSLDYNLTSTLTDPCSIRLPSTTNVPYIVSFICDG